jgi:hypothetical protein
VGYLPGQDLEVEVIYISNCAMISSLQRRTYRIALYGACMVCRPGMCACAGHSESATVEKHWSPQSTWWWWITVGLRRLRAGGLWL